MAKQIGEDTKVTLDLKTIGIAGAGLAALIGIMTTQEDVSELKEDLDRIEEKIDKLK